MSKKKNNPSADTPQEKKPIPESAPAEAAASEAAEAAAPEATETAAPQAEAPAQATPPEADTETVSAEEYQDLNDRYMRMAAEYDNFRKRSQREREQVYSDAVCFAVKALLPTYDNLERALQAETEDTEYKKGVELTMAQLTESLKGLNVTVIDASPGVAFDPNVHNAVMHAEDASLGANVVAEVFQQGFCIGDKVIRHSMVKVAN